jgi:C4-dicarboxylate transporter
MMFWIVIMYLVIAGIYSVTMPGLIRRWADELEQHGVASRAEAMRLANLGPVMYVFLGLVWPVVVFVGIRGRLRAS